jgi:membrane-associated protein
LEILSSIIDFLLNIDLYLVQIVSDYRNWTYLILFLIIFAETGFVVTPFLPGDSLLFIAGVAASGSGAAILGGASLDPLALFIGAPIAAIIGSQVGHWFGATYGRKLFNRPDGRFFTQSKVAATEKWLNKYGTGKALVLARFIPFVRTLINPLADVVGIPVKKFFFWNVLGAVVWTQGVIGLGYLLGEKLEGSVDKYLLPVVGIIIIVSVIPVAIEFFREWSTRRHHS